MDDRSMNDTKHARLTRRTVLKRALIGLGATMFAHGQQPQKTEPKKKKNKNPKKKKTDDKKM